MSKKNSNVILKNNFKDYEDISHIYSVFKNKLKYFKKKVFFLKKFSFFLKEEYI